MCVSACIFEWSRGLEQGVGVRVGERGERGRRTGFLEIFQSANSRLTATVYYLLSLYMQTHTCIICTHIPCSYSTAPEMHVGGIAAGCHGLVLDFKQH